MAKLQNPDLSGKVVLLTGAGSGFGRSMSKAFCDAGAHVFGVGRRADKLAETAKFAGTRFTSLVSDVSDPSQSPKLVEQVLKSANALHVLVNNAAVMLDDKNLSELSLELWEKTWRTNVSGMLALTQAAFLPMRAGRYGRVVNVTSGLGFFPMLEYGSYCVSKAAVNMMTRVFAMEGARDGIYVNAIDPGVARTEMNPTASESPDTINRVALFLASTTDKTHNGKCFNKRLQLVEW